MTASLLSEQMLIPENKMTHWSQKRNIRSVSAMKLWDGNPRLEENEGFYSSSRQIIKEIFETAETEFVTLLKSISEHGWLSFDTIVAIQNSKGQTVVLEGNRRVAALKLFLNPKLAPRKKIGLVNKYAAKIDLDSIRAIPVCIAPSFDDAMFFITNRHTTTPIDKWNHESQMRWLLAALEHCHGNLEDAVAKTGAAISEFNKAKRITQLTSYAKTISDLRKDERAFLNDPNKFPITTFMRVVSFSSGKDFLKIKNDDIDGNILCYTAQEDFNKALLFIIREIVSGEMNSRSISSDAMLKDYIKRKFGDEKTWPKSSTQGTGIEEWMPSKPHSTDSKQPQNEDENLDISKESRQTEKNTMPQNWRIPSNIVLHTDNERLLSVFNELKQINYSTRPNSFAILLRVFLDLATADYINSIGDLKKRLYRKAKGEFRKLSSLAYRIDFLKSDAGIVFPEDVKRSIAKFLDYKNITSLDTLNFYVHSNFMLPTRDDLKNQWNFILNFTKYFLEYEEKQQ